MFAGIYYGVAYGGTITSVLINVPGESSTVMTCLDGYQMALQGRAGAALSVAAIGSWIAGTGSIVLLMAFAPALAKFGLRFGPAEFFALTMMAFGLLTVFGGEDPFKVIISTMLGLLLTTVGLDVVSGCRGLPLASRNCSAASISSFSSAGCSGVAEVFNSIEQPGRRGGGDQRQAAPARHVPDLGGLGCLALGDRAGQRHRILDRNDSRGGITTASFIAYLAEKRYAKHPERFGRGAIEGVAAPESANNSACHQRLCAFAGAGYSRIRNDRRHAGRVHDVGHSSRPAAFHAACGAGVGTHRQYVCGQFLLLLMNIFLIPIFVAMLRIPYSIMMGLIVVFATVGAFSVNNSLSTSDDAWFRPAGLRHDQAQISHRSLDPGPGLGKAIGKFPAAGTNDFRRQSGHLRGTTDLRRCSWVPLCWRT